MMGFTLGTGHSPDYAHGLCLGGKKNGWKTLNSNDQNTDYPWDWPRLKENN